MFGLLFGTACLVGLIWMVRGGRWSGCHGPAERCRGHHVRHGRHFGIGMFLRWLFERLDTTPGQERVIKSALDDLVDEAARARREVEATRAEVARAVRGESLDAELLGEVFGKHDGALGELRKGLVQALAKVHAVLDERQRARLAELIESGLGRHWRHGPYRSAW